MSPNQTPTPNNDNGLKAIANTSLNLAQTNTVAGVHAQVDDWNKKLIAAYLTVFNNWAISVSAGRLPATNPPQPPNGYVVGYFTDPTSVDPITGEGLPPFGVPVRWAYPELSTSPVCAVPPLPKVAAKVTAGEGEIGTQNPYSPEWFNALPGDTTPIGTTVHGTSQDGKTGLFKKFGAPAGAGYFLLVG